MPVVLDASAMIAFLRGETGAAVVTEYIERSSLTAVAHALNLCEVFYDFWRAGGPEIAQNAVNDLLSLGIVERNDMGPRFWREMGGIKASQRRVSLADCAALALAANLGAPLLTADRHELEPISTLGLCELVFIR